MFGGIVSRYGPLPLSSIKTGWFWCMMLLKSSPLPLLFVLEQKHRSAQKEALKGKYHGAAMPYFPGVLEKLEREKKHVKADFAVTFQCRRRWFALSLKEAKYLHYFSTIL